MNYMLLQFEGAIQTSKFPQVNKENKYLRQQ